MSSYTVSTIVPSRQIRILPGIGKVHVVHSYDRLIPYIGHKRLTVVTARPHVYRVRPSVIVREIDRIAHKTRPYIYHSPTSSYLNSEPITFFDDETRFIRAQTASLLKKIHAPVPRVRVSWPITRVRYHYELPLPARISSDDYIHRMLTPINTVKQDIYNISHYYTEPIRRYIGTSHLACVRYAGNKAYSRRRNLTLQEIYAMQSDTVRNDIQLLSYYINANKERKALEGSVKAPALPVFRPSRVFSKPQLMSDTNTEELKELREQRAERLKKIHEIESKPAEVETARIKRSTKKQEEERLAEERALIEETVRKEKEQAKREEESRRAELVRQEALAAQAAAERQAEIERKAELAKQEELAKKAEAERAAELARIEAEKAEQVRIEEEKRQAELARQEEERQQLLRLEEIARQAEEEKEKELARQAAELAELARQEAELAEQARKEAEEQARKEEELAELAKQEAELAELERQEKELADLDRQDREIAEAEKQDAEIAEQEKEDAELAAAEAEAKILESNIPPNEEPIEPDDLGVGVLVYRSF
ncbi:uncharacterized protein CBL_20065 [Carabus blaptoides fortunei]